MVWICKVSEAEVSSRLARWATNHMHPARPSDLDEAPRENEGQRLGNQILQREHKRRPSSNATTPPCGPLNPSGTYRARVAYLQYVQSELQVFQD